MFYDKKYNFLKKILTGISLPRMSKSGEELPNARHLSNELYTHRNRPVSNVTVLTLYFGLFIDHDIIRITSKTGKMMDILRKV